MTWVPPFFTSVPSTVTVSAILSMSTSLPGWLSCGWYGSASCAIVDAAPKAP